MPPAATKNAFVLSIGSVAERRILEEPVVGTGHSSRILEERERAARAASSATRFGLVLD